MDNLIEAKASQRGSQTLDEFKARMRDAGYEDWEIQEEVEELLDNQNMTTRNTLMFKEMNSKTTKGQEPVLASSFEVYKTQFGYFHLFALDAENNVLGFRSISSMHEEQAYREMQACKDDPTFYKTWGPVPIHADAQGALNRCRAACNEYDSKCKRLDSWDTRLNVRQVSIKDEVANLRAASRKLAQARNECSIGRHREER